MRHLLLPLLLGTFAANGQAPDPTFNGNGHLRIDPSGDSEQVWQLAPLPDNGLLVMTTAYIGEQVDLLLTALNADGSPRTSFGTDGLLRVPGGDAGWYGGGLVTDAQGRAFVAVGHGTFFERDVVVMRVLPDGTLDDTYGSAGQTVLDAGTVGLVQHLVLRPNGGLGVLSWHDNIGRITLLNANGTPDSGFASGGVLVLPNDRLSISIANASNGGLWVAGNIVPGGEGDSWVARLLPNGSYDPAFGSSGQVVHDLDEGLDAEPLYLGDIVMRVEEHPLGGLLLLVNIHGDAIGSGRQKLTRLQADGALDTTFGTGGSVGLFEDSFDPTICVLLLEPDGRSIAVTEIGNHLRMEKRTVNGNLDGTWGDGGTVDQPAPEVMYYYLSAAMHDAQGRIVVLGAGPIEGNVDVLLDRFTNDLVTGMGDAAPYDHGITLYPVPSDGPMQWSGAGGAAIVDVLDAQGRSVRSQVRITGNTIDASSLMPGTYLLRFNTPEHLTLPFVRR